MSRNFATKLILGLSWRFQPLRPVSPVSDDDIARRREADDAVFIHRCQSCKCDRGLCCSRNLFWTFFPQHCTEIHDIWYGGFYFFPLICICTCMPFALLGSSFGFTYFKPIICKILSKPFTMSASSWSSPAPMSATQLTFVIVLSPMLTVPVYHSRHLSWCVQWIYWRVLGREWNLVGLSLWCRTISLWCCWQVFRCLHSHIIVQVNRMICITC